jgi:hypothetical protein
VERRGVLVSAIPVIMKQMIPTEEADEEKKKRPSDEEKEREIVD